ncbi:hypothetical protein BJ166DRAFT_510216 [Pestalotiopsis sp. NC0098]|nr:hypothetical protein BJ166DRAFT_510216 [Pestalotiopsis sp. NC0098]
MATSEPVPPAVVVGIAVGLPSLLIALISLWVAYLTYTHATSAPNAPRRHVPDALPLLPLHNAAAGQPLNPYAGLLSQVLPLLLAPSASTSQS